VEFVEKTWISSASSLEYTLRGGSAPVHHLLPPPGGWAYQRAVIGIVGRCFKGMEIGAGVK
jgi:hypothetical protein